MNIPMTMSYFPLFINISVVEMCLKINIFCQWPNRRVIYSIVMLPEIYELVYTWRLFNHLIIQLKVSYQYDYREFAFLA